MELFSTIHFDYPYLLILYVPAILILLWITRRSQSGIAPVRKRLLLFVRTLLLAAVLLALSSAWTEGPTASSRHFLFCLDISESIHSGELERALETLERATTRMAPGDEATLLVFAGDARWIRTVKGGPLRCTPEERTRILYKKTLVELLKNREDSGSGGPSVQQDIRRLQDWTESIQTERSRLDRLASLLASRCPSDRANTVVIFTDGAITGGEVHPLVPGTVRRLLYVPMARPVGPEVIVEGMSMPKVIQSGEAFDARVRLRSTEPGHARLEVAVDDVIQSHYSRPVAIHPPWQEIEIKDIRIGSKLSTGFHTVRVFVHSDRDTERRNNTVLQAVEVSGKARVLLLGSGDGSEKALADVLNLQEFSVIRENASGFDGVRDRLDDFDLVILDQIDPSRLTERSVHSLREYVSSGGGGVLIICGSRLKTVNAYSSEPWKSMLPVQFPATAPSSPAPPPPAPVPAPAGSPEVKTVKAAVVSLLLLIDKSGSMAGNNLTLAKEACLAAAETLAPQDQIAVVAFDVKPHEVLNFVSPDQKQNIEDRVLRIYADGGTNLYPAMVHAHDMLKSSAGSVKHVIVLTDGLTPAADFSGLVEKMAQSGITVSTVCVGSAEFDPNLLSEISRIGRGRFLFTDNFKNVPRIFTQETRQVVQSARGSSPKPEELPKPPPPQTPKPAPPKPGAYLVRRGADSDILKGVRPDFPKIQGYHRAQAKPMVQTILITENDRPVLAHGRYGLGQVAVWSSDLTGPWAAAWPEWEPFPKLMAQLARALSSRVRDQDAAARVTVEQDGDTATVRYRHAEDKPLNRVDGQFMAPERRTMPFRQAGPNTYRLEFPLDRSNTLYEMAVHAVYPDGTNESTRVAIPSGYPAEFAVLGRNENFFKSLSPESVLSPDRLATIFSEPRPMVERKFSLSIMFWILALVLLPLDVALQRWR